MLCPTVLLLGISIAPAAATPVVPVELRVGPYPVYYTGSPFTSYEFVPGSIPAVTDGSNDTFIRLSGHDEAPFNNVVVDTGTFYLFRFRIDPRATEFRIDVTADSGNYPSKPFGDFELFGVTPDGRSSVGLFVQEHAATPTSFGLTFFRDRNTGNSPVPREGGLDTLLSPSGDLFVMLGGVFAASLSHPGRVTTTLYDINAAYVVPEPGGCVVAAVFGLAALRRRRSGA